MAITKIKHPPNYIDLTGKRFGRLVVVERVGSVRGKMFWKCKCDCGGVSVVSTTHLKSGNTKSCGCLRKDSNISKDTTHGMRNTRIYYVWCALKKRCNNKNDKQFENYGGRGIKVCDDWLSFEGFYSWAVSSGYRPGLTIDRIDNDGNYCPENCRWATMEEQNNNKRNSIYVTYNGETHTIGQWSKITGIPYMKLWNAYRCGVIIDYLSGVKS